MMTTMTKLQLFYFQNLALFLFTDLLVVAKRKSEERFVVLDYSPRNMIQVMLMLMLTEITCDHKGVRA